MVVAGLTSSRQARALSYWIAQYRRTYRSGIISGFGQPLLVLLAMGYGLGSLVDAGDGAGTLGGFDYLTYLAPGIGAAAAMQLAVSEATYPVMASVKWNKAYVAQLASPLRVTDIVVGHVVWMTIRVALSAVVFSLVAVALGALDPLQALALVPAAVLTGAAFAAPVAAFSATQENDTGFSLLFRLGVTPLYLFSGTFFPIAQLPRGLEILAWFTPLWHGVALARDVSLGVGSLGDDLLHVAVLVAMTAAGAFVAVRTYRSRLAR